MVKKQTVNSMITRSYKPIWEDSNRQAAFEFCNRIRRRVGLEPLSRAAFDRGYQSRNIFSANWMSAKKEFANVVLGWW